MQKKHVSFLLTLSLFLTAPALVFSEDTPSRPLPAEKGKVGIKKTGSSLFKGAPDKEQDKVGSHPEEKGPWDKAKGNPDENLDKPGSHPEERSAWENANTPMKGAPRFMEKAVSHNSKGQQGS